MGNINDMKQNKMVRRKAFYEDRSIIIVLLRTVEIEIASNEFIFITSNFFLSLCVNNKNEIVDLITIIFNNI